MYYENMPLYPGMRPPCDPNPCMKVRLFDEGCCGGHRPPPMRECERVVIDNPCRRGEQAEVVLGVDEGGNLVICVHRFCGRESPCRRDSGRCPVPGCRPVAGCHPAEPWPDDIASRPLPQPRKPRHRHRPDWVCCR